MCRADLVLSTFPTVLSSLATTRERGIQHTTGRTALLLSIGTATVAGTFALTWTMQNSHSNMWKVMWIELDSVMHLPRVPEECPAVVASLAVQCISCPTERPSAREAVDILVAALGKTAKEP